MPTEIPLESIYALVNGYHGKPEDILGPHEDDDGKTTIRVMRPTASSLSLVRTGSATAPARKAYLKSP